MIEGMQKHTRQLGIRLGIVLLLFLLLATAFSLILRKEQSLKQLLTTHRKISTNMSLMQNDTRQIKTQISAFTRLLPSNQPQRSNEMLLYSRLDQIKTTLKPLEMTISAPDSKDGALNAPFTLKLPLQNYSASINSLGLLQQEHFPFVVYRSVKLDALLPGGQMLVEGNVIMPNLSGGKP